MPILAGTDYAAAAVLPLGPATHVMGYLAVHYPDQRRLSGDDWALLTAIADQTAHAVRRGQLAENEARQRARAERSERGQRLAGEVAARLERTPRPEQRMQELVDALVPAIADFATLELPTDAGVPRLAAVAHREPSAVTGLRALREHHALSPLSPADPCSVAQVLRTGRTVTLPDLSPALINQFSLDHDAHRLLTVLQPRSLLIVPLIADRQVLGVLLLGYSTSGRRYEPSDTAVVELIASRAALALRTARLYEAEHDIALTLQTSLLPAHLPSTPSGTAVPAIARLVAAHPDTVRDVIHAFNAQGLTALEPHWAGGRPRRIGDDDVAFVVSVALMRRRSSGCPSRTGACASSPGMSAAGTATRTRTWSRPGWCGSVGNGCGRSCTRTTSPFSAPGPGRRPPTPPMTPSWTGSRT